jgi:cyclic pyranopterin phosphate synthase
MLRGGAEDLEIRADLAAVWAAREDRYSELRTAATDARLANRLPELAMFDPARVEMSRIGG